MTDQHDSMYHSRTHFRQTHVEMQQLDDGAFGVVYLAKKKTTDIPQTTDAPNATQNASNVVAVKYYKPNVNQGPDVTPESGLRAEIRIMKQLQQAHQHQGILPLIDSHVAGPIQWLTTPYMAGGCLEDFMMTYPSDITIPFIWHVLYSVTEGLLYMYFGIRSVDPTETTTADPSHMPTVHADFHSANLFVGPACPRHQFSNFPAIVIADFGWSRSYPPGDSSFTFLYTAAQDFCKLGNGFVERLKEMLPASGHEVAQQPGALDSWTRTFEEHNQQGWRELTKPNVLLQIMLKLRAVADQQRRIDTTRMSLEVETALTQVPALRPSGAVEVNYWAARAAERAALYAERKAAERAVDDAERAPPGLGFEQAPLEGDYVLPGLGYHAPN
ncbi:hypothetical protein LTR56_000713 [Elasticomyces elasticus]|nr:hypothetical protein LTR22_013599 [Elasticomyces elasticus]KAK3660337.1 hypothetical protein LTR56_000713 [Elasticomyces elasticus]KAK4929270.1 hypothetical protein LTR49_004167 [Elasticomyces elasticus]KAK5765826.1 hypothetical protein LTS12_004086 [Elasticomyces elasticus]